MKVRLVDRIRLDDALHPPEPNARDLAKYSEWHHFNFKDDGNQLYGIFNLALSGNIHDPREARAGVSLVIFERSKGWHGTMNSYPIQEAHFGAGSVDLQIGGNYVKFRRDRYLVGATLTDRSVTVKASFLPQTAPIRVDNIGGLVSSFFLPRMAVEGVVAIDGRNYRLERAVGYHDHNWGYWHWGKDLGWDWGFILQSGPQTKRLAPPRLSIVFGKVTDATRQSTNSKPVLYAMVWMEEKFSQVFLDKAVNISYAGELAGANIPRIPGVMTILTPHSPSGIPKQIRITAEDGDDRLAISLDIEGAIQFLIPHPIWKWTTTITELVGEYSVEGQVQGHPISFSFVGFAELAGSG